MVWWLLAFAALYLRLKNLIQNEGFHAANPSMAACMEHHSDLNLSSCWGLPMANPGVEKKHLTMQEGTLYTLFRGFGFLEYS